MRTRTLLSHSMVFVFLVCCCSCATISATGGKDKSYSDAFEKYRADRPKPNYHPVGVEDLDKTGASVAVFYDEVLTAFDEYDAAIGANRTYVAFQNDTQGMTEGEQDAYFNSLTPEQQTDIEAVANNENVMSRLLAASLKIDVAREYMEEASSAMAASRSGLGVESLFNAPTITKAARNVVDQADYSVRTVQFMKQNHDRNKRFMEYQAR
ncbi:MAG: hypothetical protein RLY93_02735 [Sumerlaeia bacterium]